MLQSFSVNVRTSSRQLQRSNRPNVPQYVHTEVLQHAIVILRVVGAAANYSYALIVYATIVSNQHKKAIHDIQPEHVRSLQLFAAG